MLGPSINTTVSRTTAPAAQRSCTLSGHVFSDEQHYLLRAVARTRGWPGAVWVPTRVVKLLQLPLRDTRFAPVRVDTGLDHALVYHSAQFVLPLAAMQARWHDHLRRSEEAEQTRLSGLLSAQTSAGALPLNTSGERFEEATEERILRHARHVSPGASRYWTTAAEAAYLYAAPFSATYLADPANAVSTDANPLCRPLRLYNAAGTAPSDMFCLSARRFAFMAPGDFYALSQRSSFSSYTQFNDSCALTRSFQRCSPAEKLTCAERVEAINAEMERAQQAEAQLHVDNADASTPAAAPATPTAAKQA